MASGPPRDLGIQRNDGGADGFASAGISRELHGHSSRCRAATGKAFAVKQAASFSPSNDADRQAP